MWFMIGNHYVAHPLTTTHVERAVVSMIMAGRMRLQTTTQLYVHELQGTDGSDIQLDGVKSHECIVCTTREPIYFVHCVSSTKRPPCFAGARYFVEHLRAE